MALPLERVPDWARRLNEHIVNSQKTYQERGLDWGQFDCCTFAFDWVETVTGVDPMADYRGTYDDRESAIRALWKQGDKTLESALMRVFGDPIPPAMAKRGDLVFRRDNGGAAGIVMLQGSMQAGVFLHDEGFAVVAMKDCDAAFRVG